MAAAKKTTKTFRVGVQINLWVEREIEANDLSDAALRGSAMKVTDFVTIPSSTANNDYSMQIVGVSRSALPNF